MIRKPGRRTPPAVAPWTRTRLARAKGAAAALTLLVAATAFLAAAVPRQLDRFQDQALVHSLTAAGPVDYAVQGYALLGGRQSPALTDVDQLSPTGLAADNAALLSQLQPPLVNDPAQDSLGVETHGAGTAATDRWLARLSAPSTVNLLWQPDQTSHLRLLSGRLPGNPPAATVPVLQTGVIPELQIAVSEASARTMHIHVGAVLHLNTGTRLDVVGIFQPLDGALTYWAANPASLAPQEEPVTGAPGDYYWTFDALVSQGANPYLTEFNEGAEAYWWLPIAPGDLPAHRIAAAQTELTDLVSGPDAASMQTLASLPQGMTVASSLPDYLSRFTAQANALTPVLTVGAAGTAGVAITVLLMAAGLAADRRNAEFALLRARGGSLPALARRVLAETLVCTTIGTVLGASLAVLLLPTPRWGAAVLSAVAVWLFVSIAVPLRGLARHRRQRATGRGESLLTGRPSRRRTAIELGVLVAATAAVVSVRRQGFGSGGVDLLLVCAPLLLGVAGALLLVRLYPWPLRAVARPAARGRGVVGFLGLARAGRAAAGVSLLPLTALLLALTIGSFGTEVLSGLAAARSSLALNEVGADASITTQSGYLPPALVTAVSHSRGVRSVVSIKIDQQEEYAPADTDYSLQLIDPAPYSALAAADGQPGFDPALLHYSGHGPIPVVASVALGDAMGSGPVTLPETAFGTLQVKVVATVPDNLANQPGDFLLVPAAAVPNPPYTYTKPQQELLLSGPVNATALQHAVAAASGTTGVTVLLRSALEAAESSDSPLQAGAQTQYTWTVLAAALLCVLSLLLSLLQAAPERAGLLARLRTMGLKPRQGYSLILVDALPQVVLGVLAGAVLGVATVPLFGGSVDLSAMVATNGVVLGHLSLQVQLLPLLAPALLLLALAAGVVAAEAAVIGRRQIGTELRAGDRP